jgi:hypothetical protein
MVLRLPTPNDWEEKLFDVLDRLIVQEISIGFSRPYILFFIGEVKRKAPKVTMKLPAHRARLHG